MMHNLPNMHPDNVTNEVAYTLYLCHLLSTWNSRMYEFAAVVFTAEAFPHDLLASSILYTIAGANPLCRAWLTEM
jgi:iron-regulated transporter 1